MEPAVDFSDASPRHGTIAVVTGAAATIVALSGDLDLSTAPALREVLLDLVGQPLVVLDLERCTFLDSTVLGVLVAASRRMADEGGALVGVGAQGIVRNALRVTRMSELLQDVDALDPDTAALLQTHRSARD
ncbi:MAG: anti-sigma-factor antagonist [Frankiales bacterium]|nr:anti-sigma-factor antagonist [Frankiales bacterium]